MKKVNKIVIIIFASVALTYASYGLAAVKNIWLLTCLLPLARTVNLYKLKDYIGGVLDKEATQAGSQP